MGLKEGLKNTGRKLIGQGEQVRFKKDIEHYAKTNRISVKEAGVHLFTNRLEDVADHIDYAGPIGKSSEFLQQLDAAVAELGLDTPTLAALAHSPHYRPLHVPRPKKTEYKDMAKFYEGRFEKKNPGMLVVRDAAFATKSLEAHLRRFVSSLAGVTDIKAHLRTDRAAAADLGRILVLKEIIARHEHRFERHLAHHESKQQLKQATWYTMSQPVKVMHQYFKDANRYRKEGGVDGAAKLLGATIVGLPLAAAIIGGTLLFTGGRAIHTGVRKAIA